MRDNGGLSRAGESGGEKQTDSDVWRGRGRISNTWWMIGYGGRREKGAREGHVASELSDIASRFWIVAIQSALASLERTGIIMGHEPPKKVFGRVDQVLNWVSGKNSLVKVARRPQKDAACAEWRHRCCLSCLSCLFPHTASLGISLCWFIWLVDSKSHVCILAAKQAGKFCSLLQSYSNQQCGIDRG